MFGCLVDEPVDVSGVAVGSADPCFPAGDGWLAGAELLGELLLGEAGVFSQVYPFDAGERFAVPTERVVDAVVGVEPPPVSRTVLVG